MSVTHIVLFRFKPSADPVIIEDVSLIEPKNTEGHTHIDIICFKVCNRMLGLKDICLHPSSQKLYIKSSHGGRDNSIEAKQVSPNSSMNTSRPLYLIEALHSGFLLIGC